MAVVDQEDFDRQLGAIKRRVDDIEALAKQAQGMGGQHADRHRNANDPIWGEQTANTVYASNGTAGGPSFRVLTTGDMPTALVTMVLPAESLIPTTTGGCTDTGKVEISAQHDYYVLDFPDSGKTYAFKTVPAMPDGYDGGTMTARFVWFANVSTATLTAHWGIQLLGVPTGGTLSTAFGTAQTVEQDATATVNQLRITSVTSAIDPGGTEAAGNLMQILVYRDPTQAGDDLLATARLVGVTIEFTKAYTD